MLNTILKGIILITSLVILTILVIGLPKTNHTIESSFSVEEPIEMVYDYLKNVENTEEWLEGFISVSKKRGEVGEAGSVYTMSMMEFGKITEKTQTLKNLTPYSAIDFEWNKEDASGTISFELEPVGSVTQVKEVHTFKGEGLVSRFVIKVFKKHIVKAHTTSQANLKTAIEKQ